jgi:peroxiredoxin
VQIIGTSFDDPATNLAWAQQEGFQFELWTDVARELALYYGAATSPTQGSASRRTYLLDADGTLILEYPAVIAGTHPADVLEDCQTLFGP